MSNQHQAAMGLATVFGFGFIWISLFLSGFIMWVYCIIDTLKSDFKKENDKIIWLIILILTGPIGLILYWFIGRKKKVSNVPVTVEEKQMKSTASVNIHTNPESIKTEEPLRICEKCGNEMIIRKKNEKPYWVCKTYPECRNVIEA